MIKELADYVASGLPDLVIGGTLQVGFRPESAPDDCTALRTVTGGITDTDIAKQIQQPLQIITRGRAYHAADAECGRIFDFVRGIRQVSLPGFHVYTVTGISPQYLGQDAKGRHEFSANVNIRLRKDD